MSENAPEQPDGNTSAEETPAAPGRRPRIRIGFIILAILALLFGFVPPFSFVTGIFVWSCADLFLFVGLPLIGVTWAVLVLVRLLVPRWRKGFWGFALKAAVLVPAAVIALHLLAVLVLSGSLVQLMGFCCRMKHDADIASIRQWSLETMPRRTPLEGLKQVRVPMVEWPDAVLALQPGRVDAEPATREVHLSYGGGLGHWGLTVGPEDMPVPDGGGVLKLAPGAYVWSGP